MLQSTLPHIDEARVIAAIPIAVLDRKLGKQGHKALVYVLIQWSIGSREETTWELYSDIEQRFPNLTSQLEDKPL